MNQPDTHKTADKMRKISAIVLIADFLFGAVIILFGPKLFAIPQMQCFLIGAALGVGGLITFYVLRAEAEKLDKYRD
ncbi:MAG: hypothetical protein AB7E85_06110 [Pseudobdellovibrionaceae bacterium]